MNYQFILEPYNGLKTRYSCPSCNNKKVFTRYINTNTNEYIAENVGKCNREIKCGYHYTPKKYYNDHGVIKPHQSFIKSKNMNFQKNISYISNDHLIKSISSTSPNFLLNYLENELFGAEETCYLRKLYRIGTSSYWNGSTLFWQIDEDSNIRTGKIMLYNSRNGKRIKKPFSHINWLHNVLKIKGFNLNQCLFGSHLVKSDLKKTIAIVESEKTALIASIYIPEFIWLATGGINNLNYENTKILQNRNVVLFPDLGCFDLWKKKSVKLSPLINVTISTLLKHNSSAKEMEKGYDLADYLINMNHTIKTLDI